MNDEIRQMNGRDMATNEIQDFGKLDLDPSSYKVEIKTVLLRREYIEIMV